MMNLEDNYEERVTVLGCIVGLIARGLIFVGGVLLFACIINLIRACYLPIVGREHAPYIDLVVVGFLTVTGILWTSSGILLLRNYWIVSVALFIAGWVLLAFGLADGMADR